VKALIILLRASPVFALREIDVDQPLKARGATFLPLKIGNFPEALGFVDWLRTAEDETILGLSMLLLVDDLAPLRAVPTAGRVTLDGAVLTVWFVERPVATDFEASYVQEWWCSRLFKEPGSGELVLAVEWSEDNDQIEAGPLRARLTESIGVLFDED